MTVNLKLLNQNNANSKSAKQRSKRGGPGSGVEVLEDKEENALNSLCFASLRACTVAPGSGTTTQLLSQCVDDLQR